MDEKTLPVTDASIETSPVATPLSSRRDFLKQAGALGATAGIMSLVPDPIRQAAWAAGSVMEISAHNILGATRLAMARCIAKLAVGAMAPLFAAAQPGDVKPEPKYVRTQEANDGNNRQLQVAIRTFAPKEGEGPLVQLVGVVHIGEHEALLIALGAGLGLLVGALLLDGGQVLGQVGLESPEFGLG